MLELTCLFQQIRLSRGPSPASPPLRVSGSRPPRKSGFPQKRVFVEAGLVVGLAFRTF